MRSAIDMAREAGFMLRAESVKGQSDWWECFDEAIEKLVALVRADEREELLQNSVQAHEVEAFRDVVTCNAIRARGNI
jgi:hypothetical protein